MTRSEFVERELKIKLPLDYANFINELGYSMNNTEIYGYIEGMEIDKIPCVIGATKLYKEEQDNIGDKDIVIAFDDFENSPIILNENGEVYCVDFDKRKLIAKNFTEWKKGVENE